MTTTPAQYLAQLESRKLELMDAIVTADKYTRPHLAKELRNTIDEIADIAAGHSWISEQLDTQPCIRLDLGGKVLKV